MTCKDCISDEVCGKQEDLVQVDNHTWYDYAELNNVEKYCKHFKNKVDFVEVVRCRKCKHKGWVQEPCHGRSIPYCRKHEKCVDNTDFCSYGGRRNTE